MGKSAMLADIQQTVYPKGHQSTERHGADHVKGYIQGAAKIK